MDFENNAWHRPVLEILPKLSGNYNMTVAELGRQIENFLEEENASRLENSIFSLHRREMACSGRKATEAFVRGDRKLLPLSRLKGKTALECAMIYPPGICAITAGEKWTQDDISYFLFMEKYMNRYPDFAPEIIGLHKKRNYKGGKIICLDPVKRNRAGLTAGVYSDIIIKLFNSFTAVFFREVIYTMATNKNLRFKTSRRFGMNIYGHPKALKRQPAETRQKKMSEYGLQLTEKQKVKALYNLLERQFYRYYDKARRMSGVVGENLLSLLETRLDNLVYRAGFARSIRQARQMVSHGLIAVDGKKVDIPSYPVRPGQVITLKEAYRTNEMFKQAFLELKSFDLPYVEKSFDNWSATLVRTPLREELPYKDEVNETLIVELYSK